MREFSHLINGFTGFHFWWKWSCWRRPDAIAYPSRARYWNASLGSVNNDLNHFTSVHFTPKQITCQCWFIAMIALTHKKLIDISSHIMVKLSEMFRAFITYHMKLISFAIAIIYWSYAQGAFVCMSFCHFWALNQGALENPSSWEKCSKWRTLYKTQYRKFIRFILGKSDFVKRRWMSKI